MNGRNFVFTPLAEKFLAKMEWKPPTEKPKPMELHALPDPKFVRRRRLAADVKFSKDDFR